MSGKNTNQGPVAKVKGEIASMRRFWNGCDKPTSEEVKKLIVSTGMGIIAIGVTGFAIKTVSYPVFRLLSGASMM
ncbi:Sec61-gamma [Giardia duodenalis]|uniref:Sec61-gamma n=1 Tax=Giardia intestinalis (strain ATCC 50803 / WB clone C6) TaxID=184922 RepID=A8BNZ7_GIAIC|nr:Sec61-gamma [Giardia intestinalis]KAE8304651.1 Sec61-gamma [Giardia intestinalis]|eukprot:XP_001705830.1 Sec61-gamma [Giardia lamblia ATCC 50803]